LLAGLLASKNPDCVVALGLFAVCFWVSAGAVKDCDKGLGFLGWFGELKLNEGFLAGWSNVFVVAGDEDDPNFGASGCAFVFSTALCVLCSVFAGTGGEPGGVVDAKLNSGFCVVGGFGS